MSVTLLMLCLAAPASAAPLDFAAKTWLFGTSWIETVRTWLTGAAPAPAAINPAGKSKQKTLVSGTSDRTPRTSGDNGICTDPNGNRVSCPGT